MIRLKPLDKASVLTGCEGLRQQQGVTVLLKMLCWFAGGKAPNDKTHTLLSDALWESAVQQPSVEELEYTVSSSDDHHW